MVFENLQPKFVWSIFETVMAATPRPSKHEEKIRQRIKSWVQEQLNQKKLPITINEDPIGNILLRKAPTIGMEDAPSIVLQVHMDMVCETDLPNGYDFENLGIPLHIQDNQEWVDALGTTLGADDGLGVALVLALLFDTEFPFKHGPLEVLITVDEETGLTGAFNLDLDLLELKSKFLINVDSEDLGVITIGSAGGGDMIFTKERSVLSEENLPPLEDLAFFEITIEGLFGGHSGVDIHLPRANANQLMVRLLSGISEKIPCYLSNWSGGSKHNAITRAANAVISIPIENESEFYPIFRVIQEDILKYYQNPSHSFEPNLSIEVKKITKTTKSVKIWSLKDSSQIIRTINLIPHGVIQMSPTVKGLVETSNNLAIIKSTDTNWSVHISPRSNIDSELEAFRLSMVQLARMGEWDVKIVPAYPGWKPDPQSSFLKFVKKEYEKVMQTPIVIEAIHAGLETGIIGAKKPGIQMVSIGPTVQNPHSPDERARIKDVQIIYDLLRNILTNIKKCINY